MKKTSFILTLIVLILLVTNCSQKQTAQIEDAIEISIDSENDIVKRDASNYLTINITNHEEKRLKIPKANYFLDLTAEPYGNTHLLNLDVLEQGNSENPLPGESLKFEPRKTLSHKIDMEKILWKSLKNTEQLLADGDYWVRFVIETKVEHGKKSHSEIIKSNLVGIRIKNQI